MRYSLIQDLLRNTISEKPSAATMRTLSRPRSMDDIHNSTSFLHGDSFSVTKSPRRKLSFSVDDLAVISGSYHEAIAMIELKACKPVELHEIYAEPKSPVHEPPERPPTPPGMPSWTAHQNVPSRRSNRPENTPGTQNRLQRFFGLPAFSSRTTIPLGSRSASSPATFVAPRYRAPRSGYGNINQHPFNRAPTAKSNISHPPETTIRPPRPEPGQQENITLPRSRSRRQRLGKKVRFTPSTAAQDSSLHPQDRSSGSPVAPTRSSHHSTLPNLQVQRQCHHHEPPRKLQKHPKCLMAFSTRRTSLFPTSPSSIIHPWRSRSPSRDISPHPFETNSARCNSAASTATVTPLRYGSPTSSAIHLISASPTSPASPLPIPLSSTLPDCWKCKGENFAQACRDKMSRWMKESSSCFFFVCCGYDCESESRPGSAMGLGGDGNADGFVDRRYGGNVHGIGRYVVVESPRVPARMGYWGQDGQRGGGGGGVRREGLGETPIVL
jgi:hypothetical protein